MKWHRQLLQVIQPTKKTSKTSSKELTNSQQSLKETIKIPIKDSIVVPLPKPIKKSPPKPKYTYYRVRSGDNLSEIADRQGCTVQQLKTWNRLRGTSIDIGQTLVIMKK